MPGRMMIPDLVLSEDNIRTGGGQGKKKKRKKSNRKKNTVIIGGQRSKEPWFEVPE